MTERDEPHSKVAKDVAHRARVSQVSGLTKRRLTAGAIVATATTAGLSVAARRFGVLDAGAVSMAVVAGLSMMSGVVLPEVLYPAQKVRFPMNRKSGPPPPLPSPAPKVASAAPARTLAHHPGVAGQAGAETPPRG